MVLLEQRRDLVIQFGNIGGIGAAAEKFRVERMQPAEGNVESLQLRATDKGADASQRLIIARRQILVAHHQGVRPRR
jgi:hypothetical protein